MYSAWSPPTQRASVVLPEPDSPTSARHSRGLIARSTSNSTCRVPVRGANPADGDERFVDLDLGRGHRSRPSRRSVGQDDGMPDAPHDVLLCDELERRLGGTARFLRVGAARREEAAGRALARARRRPGDAHERVDAGQLRDRLDEPPRVRMPRSAKQRPGRPDLDQPAAVHDCHPGREGRDHGQVVAHVHGRDAVRGAQVAHRREHMSLRGDVESRRRLVEHDHARPVRECHCQRDALLLPARELMRVALEEHVVARQQHLAENLDDPCVAFVVRCAEPVLGERLVELPADPHRRDSVQTPGPAGRTRRACRAAAGARAAGA